LTPSSPSEAAATSPVRIAFVTTGLGTGGAESALFKLVERIDRGGFSPMVVSLTTPGEFGPRFERIGVPVHSLGMRFGVSALVGVIRLAKRLSAFKPDLVQTWMYHADLLGGVAARLAGVGPVIWGIRHSDLSIDHNKRSTLAVVRICARLSSTIPIRILSCSKRACEIHAAAHYAAGKFVVIPNGFELDRFAPSDEARASVRAELGLRPETPLVGHVGRWHPQKNHAGLITAFAAVRSRRPDVRFVLAGTDVERANRPFWELVVDAGLADVCHPLGRRDDVPRLMASLDVLASSSHGEGFPNVLGEAMAAGVCCAVTDVGDCAEVVGTTGRVAVAGDTQSLAAGVVSLLELPAAERKQLGQRARARVMQSYEIGEVVQRHERFYREIAGLDLG